MTTPSHDTQPPDGAPSFADMAVTHALERCEDAVQTLDEPVQTFESARLLVADLLADGAITRERAEDAYRAIHTFRGQLAERLAHLDPTGA